MLNKGFEGWYYKHQLNGDMIAFIPGRAESGAFVQMISSEGSRQFDLPDLSVNGDYVRAGSCLFSPYGCRIELPGVSGELSYGRLTPLRSDIMGPFRLFPMQCRHGIISMSHTLSGSVKVDGICHCFDGGVGYAEKDSGTSFPISYQWLQCNHFAVPCSVIVSIAEIPFGAISFTGCICAIIYGGVEYRIATYNGVRILASDEGHISLSQGKLLLELDIEPSNGHSLYAPVDGRMTGIIRESTNVSIRMRLWKRSKQILDLYSDHAAYEYVHGRTQHGHGE